MKISIDCDGVLSNFTASLVKIHNTLWPKRALPENYEPQDWYYTGVLSKDDIEEIFKAIRSTINFWQFVPPYKENVAALSNFLRTRVNDEIFNVTAREVTKGSPVSIQTQTWMYLNGVFPNRCYQAIIPVAVSKLKMQVMEGLGIEYSIDDYGPTVQQCQSLKNHKAYVLDRPWNRDQEYGPRVFSLQEFFDIVTRANAN